MNVRLFISKTQFTSDMTSQIRILRSEQRPLKECLVRTLQKVECTKIHNNLRDQIFSGQLHELIACIRSFGERGGVALWLDKNFSYRVALNDTVREWLLLEILSPIKLFVGVTYRCHLKIKEPKYLKSKLKSA